MYKMNVCIVLHYIINYNKASSLSLHFFYRNCTYMYLGAGEEERGGGIFKHKKLQNLSSNHVINYYFPNLGNIVKKL